MKKTGRRRVQPRRATRASWRRGGKREKAEGRLDRPALILAPTSVLPNWKAEAARFAPGLKVLPLHGPDRAQSFGAIAKHDLVLTTYPLLARDAGTLLAHEFHAAILDEAQAIKNPKAAIAGIAHQIKARHRFALTGTPLENNLGEVWSLFQFLAPGLLGDESTFRRTFRTPIEKHGDQVAQAFLSRRLKPFMLRRTKEEVATELPKKTEIAIYDPQPRVPLLQPGAVPAPAAPHPVTAFRPSPDWQPRKAGQGDQGVPGDTGR